MRISALTLALIVINTQSVMAAQQPVESITTEQKPFVLSTIDVYAQQQDKVGQTSYSQEKLQKTANSQKTISDFLRVNPNVQFGKDALAGGQQGELKASDISINGALPYDNKILLDNVSLTSQINPAGGNNEFNMAGMAGSSVATTINTDLICGLEVLDSNVSAEYGEFTGGVIKATTCAPKTEIGKLHGNIAYDYTNSAWSEIHYIDDAERLLFEENQDENYQKDFKKQGLSTSLYGRLSEDVSFSLAASKRWSDIGLSTKLLNTTQTANQQRENQNVLLNTYWQLNNQHQLKVGLQYQNDHQDLNQINVKDSNKKIDETNTALELELKSDLAWGNLTQSLVYQQQEKQNDALRNESIGWIPSQLKNWSSATTATEGGYGDQEQGLDSLEYKVKADFNLFKVGETQHQISVGAGYGNYQADWSRLADAYSYFKPGTAGISSCLTVLGEIDNYCEAASGQDKGQYHVRRYLLTAGDIDVQQDRGYVFLEDKINFKNTLKANLGLRADYDSLSKETNIAPRTSFQYLPFADERLSFTTGWNRYYANNAFSYKLQDGINLLGYNQTRKDINSDWKTTGYALSSNVARSQLDVPYTDETVFAISSRLGMFDTQLKYVHRDGKDQIQRYRESFNPIVDIYDNIGTSEADIYTLTIANHTPLQWGNSLNYLSLGMDYTNVVRSFKNYDDSVNPLVYDPYIIYEGKLIDQKDRPADNFARPWTARLSIDTEFNHIPLKISQLLRYRSKYDAMVSSTIPKDQRIEHNDFIVDTEFNPTKIGSAINWDIRTTYDMKVTKDQTLTLGLTVNNVTNKRNRYTESGSDALKSEIGRQFIADINFKF